MAFEPPSPSPTKKAPRSPWLGRNNQPPDTTPAQAIAEAWLRETNENQERWREADAKLKDLFRPSPQVSLGRKAKM
ncbi:hypothetical protein BC834DRAFT_867343 [Gloeopeniophorella convolvens]|nr:hypothetical protein BC834DRAFT_867343 [Gloeopeniophorella convolvens]